MEEFVNKWLYDPTVGKIIAAILAIIIVITIVKFINSSFVRKVKDTNVRYRTRKFVSFGGYILGILALGIIFSDKLGGLTVALGVAGAGIAFALQEVIASVAGWFAISFARFYKVGDRVQLGGIKGDVIDIGILRTTLMETGQWVNGDLYNGRVVRIANSFVFKEPVFNYSGEFPFLWDEITIPIKYGCDHNQARHLLENAAIKITGDYANSAKTAWKHMVESFMIEDAKVDPAVTLIANDNWMEFTVRYVVDYKKRRSTKDILFTKILDEIENTNGKIALASATFQLVEWPEMKINIKDNKD